MGLSTILKSTNYLKNSLNSFTTKSSNDVTAKNSSNTSNISIAKRDTSSTISTSNKLSNSSCNIFNKSGTLLSTIINADKDMLILTNVNETRKQTNNVKPVLENKTSSSILTTYDKNGNIKISGEISVNLNLVSKGVDYINSQKQGQQFNVTNIYSNNSKTLQTSSKSIIGNTSNDRKSSMVKENISANVQQTIASSKKPVLSEGSRGKEVEKLQQELKNRGYNIKIDGKFGPQTESVVKEFQKANNLKIDGVVGEQTWKILDKKSNGTTTDSNNSKMLQISNKTIIGSENNNMRDISNLVKKIRYDANLYNTNALYKHEVDLINQITYIDTIKFKKEIDTFKGIYYKNENIYKEISIKTGIPSELIAAIHYRESRCNFSTYLHNGDPLGKPTIHVPRGKNFSNFTDAAVDALLEKKHIKNKYKLSSDSTDMYAMMAFAESYNGLGYYKKGKVSPYVFSGTDVYQKGKYIEDGKYDPNAIDRQPGIYILVNSLKK